MGWEIEQMRLWAVIAFGVFEEGFFWMRMGRARKLFIVASMHIAKWC